MEAHWHHFSKHPEGVAREAVPGAPPNWCDRCSLQPYRVDSQATSTEQLPTSPPQAVSLWMADISRSLLPALHIGRWGGYSSAEPRAGSANGENELEECLLQSTCTSPSRWSGSTRCLLGQPRMAGYGLPIRALLGAQIYFCSSWCASMSIVPGGCSPPVPTCWASWKHRLQG